MLAQSPSDSSPTATMKLIKRDKLNLDIFWLKDVALEESANLPAPNFIAAEIVADLHSAPNSLQRSQMTSEKPI